MIQKQDRNRGFASLLKVAPGDPPRQGTPDLPIRSLTPKSNVVDEERTTRNSDVASQFFNSS
jgi:hypothetical protein